MDRYSTLPYFTTLAHQEGRKYFPYPVMDSIFVCRKWEEGDISEHMCRALDFLSNVSSRGLSIRY